MPRKVIVARYTEEELAEWQKVHFHAGYSQCMRDKQSDAADLAYQKQQLDLQQTKAVTDLLHAAGANLSKAGYLIGKLNKDNSR